MLIVWHLEVAPAGLRRAGELKTRLRGILGTVPAPEVDDPEPAVSVTSGTG